MSTMSGLGFILFFMVLGNVLEALHFPDKGSTSARYPHTPCYLSQERKNIKRFFISFHLSFTCHIKVAQTGLNPHQ